jgi:hypothetical protein
MKTSKTLSPKQKKIAQVAGDPNKIEGEDFKKLKTMKANEGIFAKLKKLKDLKKEGKKDSSYSNVPIDHPDVESIRKIDEKDSGLEYNEKEKQMEARGIESDKMYKSRRKAKRFVDYIQGSTARKRTATEGSFRMGGSAIKARDGVEIEKSKRKTLREAAEGARAGGASEATLKYFLDNANMSNKRPTAKTMKYFLDNANKPRDRLTERDFKMINDRFASRDREEALDKGFSDAEISAMGKKAGGAATKGKGAVARDRGMGLQDENISVGKGADYIKDLIS